MQPRNETPILRVRNLSKVFVLGRLGNRRLVRAVNEVDLDVYPGEIVALVGESGSGKTTLSYLIAHLYDPTSGTVEVDGKIYPPNLSRKDTLLLRKDVQMVFQDPYASLNSIHTVRYILSRPLKIHRLGQERQNLEQIKALLVQCGLWPPEEYLDKFPHQLSGGQRQRVGFGRALAVEPKLILADEPTSMLDVSIRLDILNLILDLKERQRISFLFITHDLAGAHYVADRIAVMYAGHIVELGSSDEVVNHPLHPYTQLLSQASPDPEREFAPLTLREDQVQNEMLPEKGCPFAPRCPQVRPECRTELPPLLELSGNRSVRCVLYKSGAASSVPVENEMSLNNSGAAG